MAGMFDGTTSDDVLAAAEEWLGTMPTDKARLALLRKLGKILEPRDELEVPEKLRTDEFVAKWDEFVAYRRKKGASVRKEYLRRLLGRLATHGPLIASQSLVQSMEQDWSGVFPEKINGNNGNTRVRTRDWSPKSREADAAPTDEF